MPCACLWGPKGPHPSGRIWQHPELRLSIVHTDARMSQQLRLKSGVLGESSVRGSNNVHIVEESEDLVVV